MTTHKTMQELLAMCEETHEGFFTSWELKEGKLYLVDLLGFEERLREVKRIQTRGGHPQATFEFSRGGGESVEMLVFADGTTAMAREYMKFVVE